MAHVLPSPPHPSHPHTSHPHPRPPRGNSEALFSEVQGERAEGEGGTVAEDTLGADSCQCICRDRGRAACQVQEGPVLHLPPTHAPGILLLFTTGTNCKRGSPGGGWDIFLARDTLMSSYRVFPVNLLALCSCRSRFLTCCNYHKNRRTFPPPLLTHPPPHLHPSPSTAPIQP